MYSQREIRVGLFGNYERMVRRLPFLFGSEDFFRAHQPGLLDQFAEFLLGGLVVGAFPGLEISNQFVFHSQSFEDDDADVLIIELPDLTLS